MGLKAEWFTRPNGVVTRGCRTSGQQGAAQAIRATSMAVGWEIGEDGEYVVYPS